MDENQRVSKLNESLRKAMSLSSLAKSPEFVNHLLPYLKELAKVEYINPRNFTNEKDYEFALDKANMRAGVYAEFISFMSQQDSMIEKIRDKIKNKPKSYGI